MLKKTKLSVIDRQYLGDEPIVTKSSDTIHMINVYNWYNYFYNAEDAKSFVIEYLRKEKMDDRLINNIENVSEHSLRHVGWNCKILLSGNELPLDIHCKMLHKIHTLGTASVNDSVLEQPVPNVQNYIENRANHIISEIEGHLDAISKTGENLFKIDSYFRTIGLKPHVAKHIIAYYKPLYSEIYDTLKTNDPDLSYAYRGWKKKTLKIYLNFIENIISSAEVFCAVAAQTRKPRKKKIKSITSIVAKIKYKQEDTEYKITSIKPTDVVGANQLWLFNTKYRTLTVLNSMSHSGLSVKGTTVTGFDEKTSITKKLRKPEVTLTAVNNAGKVPLRKMMDNIKSNPKPATGRINSDTIILRAIK